MFRKDIAPSGLPTFLLPCPHCGHRMAVTAVAPAPFDAAAGAADVNDCEDITHGCVQCGTTVTRTVRPLEGEAREIAHRVMF